MAKTKKTRPENKSAVKSKDRKPPVVAFLGHVDHGKTSLLDYIRKSKVAEKEAGGITQHIGAYQIDYKGKKITFIDTPGHEAFSAMRARGGQVSDIAVLVVAADDGVMPQTKESIAHIKAAGIPFLVAINKIDLSGVNVEKVKNQLSSEDVHVEGYGGDIVVVPVSAKTGQGIDNLLEMIDLLADMTELKEQKEAPFKGVVIESKLDKFRGPLASIIIKEGVLKTAVPIHSASASGKVKSLSDHLGKNIKEASPSTPVEVLGFTSPPKVGETVETFPTKQKEAKEQPKKISPRERLVKPKENEIHLIIKADVNGSLEAIINSLEALKSKDQEVKIYYSEIGNISESDVFLAASTNSLIIGFNVAISSQVERLAKEEKVLVRNFKLIYELLDELKEGLEALKEEKIEEEVFGEAEIIATFKTAVGSVAGCKVKRGKINKENLLILKRDKKEIGRSKITSMKHRESDINEALEGEEFGLSLEKGLNFTKGDIMLAIGLSVPKKTTYANTS